MYRAVPRLLARSSPAVQTLPTTPGPISARRLLSNMSQPEGPKNGAKLMLWTVGTPNGELAGSFIPTHQR